MIFFDLDGTLIDSNGVWREVDHAFMAKRGLELTEEYIQTVTHSIFPVAARFTKEHYHLPDSSEDIMAEWQSLAYDAYTRTIPLKEGARELLEMLARQGERIALLTATLPQLGTAVLERHGLLRYFEGLFFAQDTGLEKKDPQVYILAAQQFHVDPADCILVEDAPHNCAAARSVGYTVVGLYDAFYDRHWPAVQAHSHRAVKSLAELLSGPPFAPVQ